MDDPAKQDRHAQIEAAAYALLADRGFEGTSMLHVAKAAKASNQTLYRWYGDKTGLFARMVESNVAASRDLLDKALDAGAPPLVALERLGPVLLTMLLGERAVLLNRCAASDRSGRLGRVLAEGGRQVIAPRVATVLERARSAGEIAFDDTGESAALYLDLLIGDLQVRRVTGALPPPDAAFIDIRATRALTLFRRLTAPALS